MIFTLARISHSSPGLPCYNLTTMSKRRFRFLFPLGALMVLALMRACASGAVPPRDYTRLDDTLWQREGTGDVRSTSNGLEFTQGNNSLTLKSRDFFSACTLNLTLGPVSSGRTYGAGLLSADQHDGIFLSQDLADYAGLALRVFRGGKEIKRLNFGPPTSGMQFTIQYSPNTLTIRAKVAAVAEELPLFKTRDPQQIPSPPLQLYVDAYHGAHVRFDRLLLSDYTVAAGSGSRSSTASSGSGSFVPSVWAAATPVARRPRESGTEQDLTTVIANDQVQLKFKSAEKGFGLGSMVFLANGRDAISQVDNDTKWWEVQVRLPDGKIVTLDNLGARTGAFEPFADRKTGGRFIWQNLRVPGDSGTIDVTVTVRLESGSSLARMRIQVANHLQAAGLWKINFPKINHLGYPGESDCMVPTTYTMMTTGELRRAATGVLYWAYAGSPAMEYPSGAMPIQHLSCSIGDDTVVYLGCHDGKGNTKGYGWIMEDGLTFHIWPENMSVPGASYDQDWDYVIGPMKGDWFDAARVYRAWATQQLWCAKGRLEDRSDKSKEFFEVPYWGDPQWPSSGFRQDLRPMDEPAAKLPRQFQPASFDPNARSYDVQAAEMTRRVERSVADYGLPLGIQWYTWHNSRFDGDYPDYFPPRPGFEEALHKTTRPGMFVHGFINGIWFDRSLPEFKEAAPNAMLDIAESAQLGSGGEKDPLRFASGEALMCPTTPYWQKRMADIAAKMAALGFQGAYLDVLANIGDQHCFNPNHGHPLGGGHWFVDGARKMVEGMKGDGKLLYICSESFNETLGQAVDLFYTWNDLKGESAPLLGAIYGGYLQWYGSETSNTVLLTRSVFWGGHISLYASQDVAAGHEGMAGHIANLIALQRKGKKYLTYGTMIRPPAWTHPVPRLAASATIELEGVERAAWQASDGSIGLCLMNYTAAPVQVDLDLSTLPGGGGSGSPTVLQKDGTSPATAKVEGKMLHVSLPAQVPVLIAIR